MVCLLRASPSNAELLLERGLLRSSSVSNRFDGVVSNGRRSYVFVHDLIGAKSSSAYLTPVLDTGDKASTSSAGCGTVAGDGSSKKERDIRAASSLDRVAVDWGFRSTS